MLNVHWRKVGSALGLSLVLLVLLTGCGKEPVPVLLGPELSYYEQIAPLIHRAALEGGTPLALVMLSLKEGLTEGNVDDWQQFVDAVNIALPVYKEVYAEWIKIHPPRSGITPKLQRAYSIAWGERIDSLTEISIGWRTADEEFFTSGIDRMDTASELGLKAEDLRLEFNNYLLELCNVHRIQQCPYVVASITEEILE